MEYAVICLTVLPPVECCRCSDLEGRRRLRREHSVCQLRHIFPLLCETGEPVRQPFQCSVCKDRSAKPDLRSRMAWSKLTGVSIGLPGLL